MIRYAETAEVTCVDNNQKVQTDVLSFEPLKLLTVSIQKSIKLVMKYNVNTGEYFGELYGKTFVTTGPKPTYYSDGRRK